VQELNIEKQLEKIDNTWRGLNLSFSQYQDTDVYQMKADDAITEALEADNLTLQNMSAGKYVQVCFHHKSAASVHLLVLQQLLLFCCPAPQ
jgi:Dynein heavy chain, N-terminal region 2